MFDRAERLKELYKRLVNELLREVKDPGLAGFLTVTDLELSADRKTAVVHYSILGSDAERARAAKALERAAPYLRGLLRKRAAVKIVPQLVFSYDDTPRQAARIDALLHRLEKERGG
ncbi:MAG: 30S ribosome-binding factor RbfA [Elusimicrobia bacterium]|nr:30S ribosome-binding factor RbfA [Elusimicrobiota bacterium]